MKKGRGLTSEVAALLMMAFVANMFGLINPKFTPVHLTQGAETILEVKVPTGDLSDEEAVAVPVIRTLKGDAPGEEIMLMAGDPEVLDLFEGDERTGAVFINGEGGCIEIGGIWVNMVYDADSEMYILLPDETQLNAVWAGSAEMLLRAVKYIQEADEPILPVSAGTSWKTVKLLGNVQGNVSDILQLPGKGMLLITSDKGDQLVTADSDALKIEKRLPSASAKPALAELTGDEYWDLISWDGKKLALLKGTMDGFEDNVSASAEFEKTVLDLQAMPDRKGVMISTAGAPQLLTFENSELKLTPLCKDWPDIGKAKPERPMVCIDMDGDGVSEWVQPASRGYVLVKKAGDEWNPEFVKGIRSGFEYADSAAADIDHDGRLDIAISGGTGLSLWRNTGKGFTEQAPSGETDYIPTAAQRNILVNDFNADGLQDLVILYKAAVPHLFFNRGFAAYGFAGGLDLSKGEVSLKKSVAGQQAGELVDLDGDGALDFVMVLSDGSVYGCIRKKIEDELSVLVCLADGSAPVTVNASNDERKFGAWQVKPGEPVCIGTPIPGPVFLKWETAEGKVIEKEIIVDEKPVIFQLGGK